MNIRDLEAASLSNVVNRMTKKTTYNEWFDDLEKTPEYEEFLKKPIAYFSAEYAILSTLPTYAGGLGILSGDYIKEVSARKFPLLSVGLLYRKAQNNLCEHGKEIPPENDLTVVKNDLGERVLVSVPIHDRKVFAQGWHFKDKDMMLYMLDTDIEENDPNDRKITERLYTEDREIRLKQEILLGIGGLRFLQALGYHPSVFHLNEGHSAFLALELVHHEMKHQRIDFAGACDFARKHIVFTNHTLVAAGQEQFSTELVSAMMEKYAEEIGVAVASIVALGALDETNIFSMTTFSFRLSNKANAVSVLHAKVAAEVWPKYKMESVTNGINIARFDNCDKVLANASENAVETDSQILEAHKKNKLKLLAYVKEKTGKDWSEDSLVLAWGRRFVAYKRPLALFEDIVKLKNLASDPKLPIKIILSCPTRNDGDEDNALLLALKKIIDEEIPQSAVFLPNYNSDLASLMTSGADVWLNTPVVGAEACGTSGMKAALNGTLALSTADGWMAEINIPKIGWIIEEPSISDNILSVLESKIIPLYKEHLQDPSSSTWLSYMKNARNLILENFGTDRMLKEYIEKLYIPTLREKHGHLYE